jgi:DNA-binding GntR family transcriptional regulator
VPRPPAPWVRRLAIDGPGTSHEAIRDQLRTAIPQGAAPPGAAIGVDDVADRFTVSRIPVREALKTLVGEGLVSHEPRAGYFVAHLTRAELLELYVVREALESAAQTAAVAQADGASDTEARDAHAALTRAIDDGDVRAHHRESRRFHLALAAPCRMRRLLHMFEAAWDLTEPFQPMSHVDRPQTRVLHDEHGVMLAAFLARDADALVAVSRAHHGHLREVLARLPAETGLFALER